ncbi:hypothetical protein BSKO_09744 [Bryopsis sp. KO-2023]|nr:hypothetical protein BSKO_09744 [Bryopsis sp. KO-2023]
MIQRTRMGNSYFAWLVTLLLLQSNAVNSSIWTPKWSSGKKDLSSGFQERNASRRLLASLKDWGGKGLIAAARDNDVGRVGQLLGEGCDINGRDFFGLTPLHWATARASNDAAQLLIERGAEIDLGSTRFLWVDGFSLAVGTTPLFIAASLDRQEILQTLIAKGADVNGKAANGWTPLHRAAEQGQYHSTMALLNAGADANAKTQYGETPLMCAAFKGEIDIAQALLDAGAEKEHRTSEGDAVLHRAATNFHNAKMIEFLSKAGCDANSQNHNGWTPLHKSAWTTQPDGIKALADAGADINSKDVYGRTPLHVAAARGGTPQGIETVKVLLSHGAEKGLQNKSGWTPKEVICQQAEKCPSRTELESLL